MHLRSYGPSYSSTWGAESSGPPLFFIRAKRGGSYAERSRNETRDREEVAMAGKNIAVFGIYPHRASFEYALGALEKDGFRDTDVSVLLQENPGSKDLVTEKGTKAPEGAA